MGGSALQVEQKIIGLSRTNCEIDNRSSSFDWQAEREYGTLPGMANGTDGSTVRFDNRFCDRQAHAGPVNAIAMAFPPVEFFKNMADFRFFNPGPLVRNGDDQKVAAFFRRDRNGLARRRV